MAMRQPKAKRVTKAGLGPLIKAGIFDDEMSKLSGLRTYALADGSLLVLPPDDGAGYLYPSRISFGDYMRYVAGLSWKHILAGRAAGRRGFIGDVDSWIARLRQMLSLVNDELDFTMASLERIDVGIGRTELEFLDAVVAYVGEMAVRNCGGMWKEVLTDDGSTYEPVVVVGSWSFQPAPIVFEQLRLGKKGSLAGAVEGALARHLERRT